MRCGGFLIRLPLGACNPPRPPAGYAAIPGWRVGSGRISLQRLEVDLASSECAR